MSPSWTRPAGGGLDHELLEVGEVLPVLDAEGDVHLHLALAGVVPREAQAAHGEGKDVGHVLGRETEAARPIRVQPGLHLPPRRAEVTTSSTPSTAWSLRATTSGHWFSPSTSLPKRRTEKYVVEPPSSASSRKWTLAPPIGGIALRIFWRSSLRTRSGRSSWASTMVVKALFSPKKE